METLTPFEVLYNFALDVLATLKGLAYDLYSWLYSGFEFTWDDTTYSVSGLEIIGATAVTFLTARIFSAIAGILVPD